MKIRRSVRPNSYHVANQQSPHSTEEHNSKFEDENTFSSEDTHHLLP